MITHGTAELLSKGRKAAFHPHRTRITHAMNLKGLHLLLELRTGILVVVVDLRCSRLMCRNDPTFTFCFAFRVRGVGGSHEVYPLQRSHTNELCFICSHALVHRRTTLHSLFHCSRVRLSRHALPCDFRPDHLRQASFSADL